MSEGIEEFEKRHPKYGAILRDIIAEERAVRETHMTFGLYEGRRITADDYRDVMANLGFTPAMAEQLYPALMDASRKISRARVEDERSIMIG
jgi:hypothetical protein